MSDDITLQMQMQTVHRLHLSDQRQKIGFNGAFTTHVYTHEALANFVVVLSTHPLALFVHACQPVILVTVTLPDITPLT